MLLSIQSFFGDAGAGWTVTWLPLSLLAVITSFIIYNILLMFGKAFSIKELETFARSEMLQAAATAFMAIFLVLMVGSAMELVSQLIAGEVVCDDEVINIPYADNPETAQSAMDNSFDVIRCRLQTRAKEIAEIQGALIRGAADEFNELNRIWSIFGVTVYKGDWNSQLYRSTETKRITNNLATVLLIALNAQSAILEYLKANMLHIFIPVGILLRSFYFTRGPGALFISIGIGMYFIFPVFFVLLDPGFTPAPPPPVFAPQHQPYCYATMSNTVSVLNSMESTGFGSTSNVAMDRLRDDLSKSYISLILHPLIALFLTLIFIRYMLSVLGGDTYELTKMVSKVI